MEENTLTPREAWAHFWDNVRPEIWHDLDKAQRNELSVAHFQFQEKAPGYNLGTPRIVRLLAFYAADTYRFEKVEVFHLI